MLVNPPPHLSHALSSMHRECVYTYMKQMGREEKLSHGGGSGGGLIGPRNAAQFKNY